MEPYQTSFHDRGCGEMKYTFNLFEMIHDTRQCKLFIIVFKIMTSITSLFMFYRSGVRFLGLRDPSAPGTVAVRSDLTFTGQAMKTKSR